MKTLSTAFGLMLTLAAFCMLMSVSASCKPAIDSILILETDIVVNNKGVEIQCDPPLSRSGRSASVMMAIEGAWTVSPPWEMLTLSDGSEVALDVFALTEDGRVFKSSVIGQSGPYVNVRFKPQIPKTAVIKTLQIVASEELYCKKLIWHDFDYL